MRSINFELTEPIHYKMKNVGELVACNHIELREPTGRVSHLCCAIEGLIQTGTLAVSKLIDDSFLQEAKAEKEKKEEEEEENQEKDGKGVLSVMSVGGVDMTKLVLHFKELFKETAFMSSEKLMTSARLDEMSHRDLRSMMGVYAENFILI